MLVLKDIEYLQLSSFKECVSRFLPNASAIYIIYGIQWIPLLDMPRIDGVVFHWYSEHRESWVNVVKHAVEQAKSDDVLVFIDPATLRLEKSLAHIECESLRRPIGDLEGELDEID
jgi:hypothetical protein